MNCSNCAAPLEWKPGTELMECRYCRSQHKLRPFQLADDNLQSTEIESERTCPVCDLALTHGVIDTEPVEFCSSCHGLLFAGDVLHRVVQVKRASYRGVDAAPQPYDPTELSRAVDCPDCGQAMEVHPYYGPGNQVLDSCPDCRLVWLDPGELGAIERAPGRR